MKLMATITMAAAALFVQNAARAESLVTSVFNVYESKKSETILILSGADGRIYKTAKSKKNLEYMKAFKGQIVELSYQMRGEEAFIDGIRKVGPSEVNPQEYDLNHFQYNQLRQFAPTDLQSKEKVDELFTTMLNDGDKRRSQCFKRAHVWAYDMWAKSKISSEKIFLFYTERYRFLQEEKWWFHVAPVVTSGGMKYVMDGTFMEKPMEVKAWTDFFIKTDKITCPAIKDITQFEKNQWSRLCYTMTVPMYHLSPLDIAERDQKGVKRNNWIIEELQDARRAFKGYESTYEGLDTGKETITY